MAKARSSGVTDNYQRFSDRPIEGREAPWRFDKYGEDTADAQHEFFDNHTNYNQLIGEMNSGERDAFDSYWATGHFMSGQQYRGWDNMTVMDRQLTRIFDKFLDRATLDRGLVVKRIATAELVLGAGNRGTKGSDSVLSQLQAMVGSTVKSLGAMSTAAAAVGLPIASPSSDDKAVEYTIKIPGGKASTGAGMWIGDRRINSWHTAQREFMVNRDTFFKVDSVRYNARTGRHEVELTYIGLDNHDYGRRSR